MATDFRRPTVTAHFVEICKVLLLDTKPAMAKPLLLVRLDCSVVFSQGLIRVDEVKHAACCVLA